MDNWEVINKNDIEENIMKENINGDDIFIKFLVDRSGSMKSMGSGVYNGIKTFIKNQKEEKGENNIFLTIKSFDDTVEVVQNILETNIDNLDPEQLTRDNLRPRGATRLIDTAIEELNNLENILNKNKNSQGVFALLTDGHDNISYNTEKDLNRLILKLREKGINCIFLGANQDAISQGNRYGFSKDQSLTYTASKVTSEHAIRSLSSNISRLSTGKKVGFTELERLNSCN